MARSRSIAVRRHGGGQVERRSGVRRAGSRDRRARQGESLPQLGSASGLVGQPVRGSAELSATISGTEDRPKLQIDATGKSIGVAASGAERAEARVHIGWSGNPADESAAHRDHGERSVRGIAMPEGAPRELGRDLEWSLAAVRPTQAPSR